MYAREAPVPSTDIDRLIDEAEYFIMLNDKEERAEAELRLLIFGLLFRFEQVKAGQRPWYQQILEGMETGE